MMEPGFAERPGIGNRESGIVEKPRSRRALRFRFAHSPFSIPHSRLSIHSPFLIPDSRLSSK